MDTELGNQGGEHRVCGNKVCEPISARQLKERKTMFRYVSATTTQEKAFCELASRIEEAIGRQQ